MQLAAAGYLEGFRGIRFLHPQGHICVQLPEQSVPEMPAGHVFALLAGEGGIVDDEVHGDGGLGNLLERDRDRIFRGAEGISDVDVRNAGNGHDGTDGSFLYFYLVQAVEFIQAADAHPFLLVRLMVVDDHHILPFADDAVIHLSHADAAHVFIIIDGADEHLGPGVRISLGSRDIVDDGI